MYNQSLVKVVKPIKKTTITRLNRGKKWKYGYDKEHDIVVISKNGKIGEILEIQNLHIALPPVPVQVHGLQENKWKKIDYPQELQRIKNIFDWRAYPEESKDQWKLVKQIKDVMVCVTLKTDVVVLVLCLQLKQLI